MSAELTWTLDDRRLPATRGQTVLEAAERAGMEIPHLCHGPNGQMGGRCRICTVTVNGRPRAACTEPVTEGARVECDTSELRSLRRTIVEVLLAECEGVGDETELGRLAARIGAARGAFVSPVRATSAERAPHGARLAHALCTMCGRCAERSVQLGRPGLVCVVGRGAGERIWVDDRGNGAVRDVLRTISATCPTGALTVIDVQ